MNSFHKFLLIITIQVLLFFSPIGVYSQEGHSLRRLLNKGPLINVEKDKEGNVKFATAVILINAAADKVWEVIIDFEKYPEFLPECKVVKVLAKGEKSAVVDYLLKINFLKIINVSIKYSLKYTFMPKKKMEFRLIEGDLKEVHGYWELLPVDGGKKTILYYGYYADIKSLKLVDLICRQDPQVEPAFLISGHLVTISAIKDRVEKGK